MGIHEQLVDLDAVASPFARELGGDWSGAAERWDQLGCPYEGALVRAHSGDEASLRLALGVFQGLGAVPAARATAQRLRGQGATSIGRGPHRSTVENPGQLTARQLEILLLLADRLTNTQIAARLYISPKTVDHHVSAILAKLGVHSRRQAAAEAVRLGLAEKQGAGHRNMGCCSRLSNRGSLLTVAQCTPSSRNRSPRPTSNTYTGKPLAHGCVGRPGDPRGRHARTPIWRSPVAPS